MTGTEEKQPERENAPAERNNELLAEETTVLLGYTHPNRKRLLKDQEMNSFLSDILSIVKPLGLYSDEELSETREEYRQRHCKGDSMGTRMIEAIDNEIRRRNEKKYGPVDPSTLPHREHGWYLPNDD